MSSNQRDDLSNILIYCVFPFLLAAVVLWLSPLIIPSRISLGVTQAVLIFGAVLVSFLSGIGAGVSLAPGIKNPRPVGSSLAIMIIAVFTIAPNGLFYLGTAWRYLIILVLLLAVLMRDMTIHSSGNLPRWYIQARTRMTTWSSLFIGIIIIRLMSLVYY